MSDRTQEHHLQQWTVQVSLLLLGLGLLLQTVP